MKKISLIRNVPTTKNQSPLDRIIRKINVFNKAFHNTTVDLKIHILVYHYCPFTSYYI